MKEKYLINARIIDPKSDDTYVILKVVKTNKSDIYDLYTDYNFYDIAYIPTLRESRKILKLFENESYLVFKCQFSTDYKKWIPVEKVESNAIIDSSLTLKKLEEKYELVN